MSIANILISIITWVVQKMILPIFPTNLPLLSFENFNNILQGGASPGLKHNLIWAFAGINQFFNLKLFFILLIVMIFAETLFWLFRVGIFIIKIIRG